MKKKKSSTIGLLRPFSMEPEKEYYNRFVKNPEMIDLFADESQRLAMAKTVFEEKCQSALVTVKKLDGTRFFID